LATLFHLRCILTRLVITHDAGTGKRYTTR
jgi:hypothetical protein